MMSDKVRRWTGKGKLRCRTWDRKGLKRVTKTMASENFRYFSDNAVLEADDALMVNPINEEEDSMKDLIKAFENMSLDSVLEMEDVTDGSFERILKIAKGLLASLLDVIINRDLSKNCEGCAMDHPSQQRHSCLFKADTSYFNNRFEVPWLNILVSKALAYFNAHSSLTKIKKLVEAILQELRPWPYIREKLQQIQEELDNESKEIVKKITSVLLPSKILLNPKLL
ncbi:UNVERIFIED_CONTAM: hypothetical protein FKN15_065729 [Acipenser sinensis]